MSETLLVLIGLLSAVAAFWSARAASYANRIARDAFSWQRSQNGPNVIVRAHLDDSFPTGIFLSVENIGGGIAYDVKFDLERSIPARAFGNTPEDAELHDVSELVRGPLVNGIPALAPGDKRKFVWGQFAGLYKVLGDDFVTVRVSYLNDARESCSSLNALEVKSFEGHDVGRQNDLIALTDQLKEISKTLDQSASGFRPLVIESPEERRIRHEESLRLYREKQSNAHHA